MLKEVPKILGKMNKVVELTEAFNKLISEIDSYMDNIYDQIIELVKNNKIEGHVITVDVSTLNGIFKAILLKVRESITNEETTYSFTINGMVIDDDSVDNPEENCVIVKGFDTPGAEILSPNELPNDMNPDLIKLLNLIYDNIHYSEE